MKKKKIAVFVAVVAAFTVTAGIISGQKKSLVSQTMADRWSADGSEFAQVSVFFPYSKNAAESDALFLSEAIKKNINEGSFTKGDNDPENLWTDAYSTEAVTVSVFTKSTIIPSAPTKRPHIPSVPKKSSDIPSAGGNSSDIPSAGGNSSDIPSAVGDSSDIPSAGGDSSDISLDGADSLDTQSALAKASGILVVHADTIPDAGVSSGKGISEVDRKINVIGVGGEFFEFHPLELLSGNYIYADEIREDRVVLDEDAAWILFSSVDVVGMNIWVNNTQLEIAGVVRRESEKEIKTAYPVQPIMYMHYSMLETANIKSPLVCYEAVMPNPVDNYAKNTILTAYGIDTMVSSDEQLQENIKKLDVEVLDNTSRYSVPSLFCDLKEYGKSAVVSKAIGYPYWENAARVLMTKLTLLFGVACLLATAGIIMILIFIVKIYLRRTWHLKDFIEKLTYKYTYKKKISDYINIEEKTGENK